ncbi:hypothetical protein DPMN_153625 [Dreissena polymorpha]|uniref:Uncharacterized protein n=1 Tax=Dreissena polymorpha TaxID=45954 RepID=A0A9D4J4Z9_DREPO|nr:hypothetical protein DPMN_153625 [Dreissena polymorpha]
MHSDNGHCAQEPSKRKNKIFDMREKTHDEAAYVYCKEIAVEEEESEDNEDEEKMRRMQKILNSCTQTTYMIKQLEVKLMNKGQGSRLFRDRGQNRNHKNNKYQSRKQPAKYNDFHMFSMTSEQRQNAVSEILTPRTIESYDHKSLQKLSVIFKQSRQGRECAGT